MHSPAQACSHPPMHSDAENSRSACFDWHTFIWTGINYEILLSNLIIWTSIIFKSLEFDLLAQKDFSISTHTNSQITISPQTLLRGDKNPQSSFRAKTVYVFPYKCMHKCDPSHLFQYYSQQSPKRRWTRVKNLTSEWNQKQQHYFKHASRSLQCIKFVAEAFRSEEKVCQRTGSSVNYFVPTLDPPLGRSVPKTTILVGDHQHFIHTKFRQIPFEILEKKSKIKKTLHWPAVWRQCQAYRQRDWWTLDKDLWE